MYLATTTGFFGGILAVVGTMLAGGHIRSFIAVHGFSIVFVGGFFAVMYTALMEVFLGSSNAMGTAFKKHNTDSAALAQSFSDPSTIACKGGLMAAYCEAAIEGLRGIACAEVPRVILDGLAARLPPAERAKPAGAA